MVGELSGRILGRKCNRSAHIQHKRNPRETRFQAGSLYFNRYRTSFKSAERLPIPPPGQGAGKLPQCINIAASLTRVSLDCLLTSVRVIRPNHCENTPELFQICFGTCQVVGVSRFVHASGKRVHIPNGRLDLLDRLLVVLRVLR